MLTEFYNLTQGHITLTDQWNEARVSWDILHLQYKEGQGLAWKNNREQAVYREWNLSIRTTDWN